jgi:hypothetical protein
VPNGPQGTREAIGEGIQDDGDPNVLREVGEHGGLFDLHRRVSVAGQPAMDRRGKGGILLVWPKSEPSPPHATASRWDKFHFRAGGSQELRGVLRSFQLRGNEVEREALAQESNQVEHSERATACGWRRGARRKEEQAHYLVLLMVDIRRAALGTCVFLQLCDLLIRFDGPGEVIEA